METATAAIQEKPALSRIQKNLLLIATAVCSGCGLAAELLLGTLASYLVGNQALSYGLAVGGFLAAMGIGAYLSRFIAKDLEVTNDPSLTQSLLLNFVKFELLIAPLTALLPLALFGLFVIDGPLWLGLLLVTTLLGTLAGLDAPLLTRILEKDEGVGDALAGVLALDYLGALIGSLIFPVLLLPFFGLFTSAALIGSLPAFMVFVMGWFFPELRTWGKWGLLIGVLLCAFAPVTIWLSNNLENNLYNAPIVARIQSPYQRIVLTRQGQDVRLFLDGDLQLSTLDEYRYHEALVHPAIAASYEEKKKLEKAVNSEDPSLSVLVLGAGDGMALREVLKWPQVKRVLLIDLDEAVVKLAKNYPFLARVNHHALEDPRVETIYADAFITLPKLTEKFDTIIADFPDPDREVLAKLYAQGFYKSLLPRLAPNGVFVTQASSPFFAPRVLSCIATTLESIGLSTYPYTIDVPSFGPWGFVLASHRSLQPETWELPIETRFLTKALLSSLFHLPADIQLGNVEINRLSHPVIVRYQSDPKWEFYQ